MATGTAPSKLDENARSNDAATKNLTDAGAAAENAVASASAAASNEMTPLVTPTPPPAAPAPDKKSAAKPAPAFKSPLAVSEPTKEMLVPGILVVAASVLSWTAGKYNMSVLVSLGIGSVVYLSIKTLRDRLTRAATIYADRNAQRKRVIGDEESAEWINTVLWRFWQFYEPVLCQNLREAIQPALDANTPAGLKRLELGRLTLGKTPPFISSARLLLRDNHHNEISESRIVLNLGLGFHAPDLEVVVAAKTVAASLPLAVKNVWFEGMLRVEIELVPDFPHAKTVLVTFLDKPIIDFSVIPLKSVNIFDLPGLSQFISNLIINGISENLVNPEKLVIDLIPAECGPVEAAKGVLFVSVDKAMYKETNALDVMSVGSSEVYAEIKVGKDVVRTQAVSNGKGEVLYAFGGETLAVLVKGNLAAEKVTIYLRQRRMSGHRLLGKVYVPVADIVNSPNSTITETLDLEAGNGSVTATFAFKALAKVNVEEGAGGEEDASVSTTAEKVSEVGDDSTKAVSVVAPAMKSVGSTGSLLVRLHQGQDLAPKDSNGFSDPFASLFYTNKLVGQTPVFPKTLSPKFEWNKEYVVQDIDRVRFTLRVFDKEEIGSSDAMGDLDIDMKEIFPIKNQGTGERDFVVLKKWMPLRAPGPVIETTRTAADLKRRAPAKKETGFGHVLLSFIFRPTDIPPGLSNFQADLGNPEDDLSLTPYQGSALDAIGSGLGKGVGAIGSKIGAVGGGVIGGVGMLGSGVADGLTGTANLLGNGLKGAVNLTGKGGNSMAKHMSSFSADATPRSKKAFFSRRKSGEMDSSR